MALTFPLSLSEFFGGLALVSWTFDLTEAYETSETGGGEILRSSYGPRLWEGTVSLRTRYHQDAERINARVRSLFDARASFLIYPPHMATLTSSATLNAQRNGKEMRLGGLTAGEEIRQGQFLAFQYGSPARQALHQSVEDVTADGTGLTPYFEVVPAIRPNTNTGATVTLGKPVCKAIAIPGSYSPASHRPLVSSGVSFAWRQTLR